MVFINFKVFSLKGRGKGDLSDVTPLEVELLSQYFESDSISTIPTLEEVTTIGNTTPNDIILDGTSKKVKSPDGKRVLEIGPNYTRIFAYAGDGNFPDTEARVQVETNGGVLIQGESAEINIREGAITGQDETFRGLEYATDYSLNFTDRSLIDKGYVDGKIADLEIPQNLIEVTYAELLNLTNTSSLIPGQIYLLIDYMTTYIQPVTGASKSSGIVEPLYITALGTNILHKECRSQLYPQDLVYYEITGDIGVKNISDSLVGTEGFTKGKIYRRIDTLKNNDIGTDWRHVKYDRGGVDKLLFENYDGIGSIVTRDNIIETYYLFNTVVTGSFIGNKVGNHFYGNNIFEFFNNVVEEKFVNNNMINLTNQCVFGRGFGNNVIGNITILGSSPCCSDVVFGSDCTQNTIINILSSKIGVNFSANTMDVIHDSIIESNCSSNTIDGIVRSKIGFNFANNTGATYITDSFIGEGFKNNVNFSVYNSTIGYGAEHNTGSMHGCTVGNIFYFNSILSGYNEFYSNTIGDNCSHNQFSSYIYNNTIGAGFSYNIITLGASNNEIGNGCHDNLITGDFSNNKIGVYFGLNTMVTVNLNTIGDNCDQNTFGDNFTSNFILNGFSNNVIGQGFYANTIGNDFVSNNLGPIFYNNTITNSFSENTVGSNCAGNHFQFQTSQNIIGDLFTSNKVVSSLGGSTIGNYFTYNTINIEGGGGIGDITGISVLYNSGGYEVFFSLIAQTLGYKWWDAFGDLNIETI